MRRTCFTCSAPLPPNRPKFCNAACNNRYKGLRDTYLKRTKVADLRWPYGESDDPVVVLVNRVIPRDLPEQIRAEACQELAVAILSGRCSKASARKRSVEYVARARKGYQFSSRNLSLELPMPGSATDVPLKDRL